MAVPPCKCCQRTVCLVRTQLTVFCSWQKICLSVRCNSATLCENCLFFFCLNSLVFVKFCTTCATFCNAPTSRCVFPQESSQQFCRGNFVAFFPKFLVENIGQGRRQAFEQSCPLPLPKPNRSRPHR